MTRLDDFPQGKTFHIAPSEDAWDIVVIRGNGEIILSRNGITLALADKDGSAHVDEELTGKHTISPRTTPLDGSYLEIMA